MALVLSASVAGSWVFGTVRLWSIAPFSVLVFLGGLLCVLKPLFWREPAVLRLLPGFGLAALFLLYAACRVPAAASLFEAKVEVLKISTYLVALGVWTRLSAAHQRWRWLLGLLLVSVSLMAWYALIQEAHGSARVLNLPRHASYGLRASGAYMCPNHFANLLDIALVVSLALVGCQEAGFGLRSLAGYTFVLALPPLYLTQSRSGWIGAAVGIAVTTCLLALRRSVRRFLLAAVALPLILAGLGAVAWAASPMVQNRVAAALQGDVRLGLWRDTWALVQQHPWLGYGPSSFAWVYPRFQHHMTLYLDPKQPHNEYLGLLANYGVVGLLLAGSAVVTLLTAYARRVRRVASARDACLLSGTVGALSASLAHACFDFNLQVFSNWHALLLVAGVTGAGLFASGDLKERVLNGWRRHLYVGGGVAAGLLLIGLMAQAWVSYGLSLLADRDRDAMLVDRARQRYEWSMRVDPSNWSPCFGLAHLIRGEAQWNLHRETRAQQIAEARGLYERAARLNRWELSMQHGLAKLEELSGRPERAAELLQDLVSKQPIQAYYLAELGLQLRSLHRWSEALDAFQRARQIQTSEMIEINIALLQAKVQATP